MHNVIKLAKHSRQVFGLMVGVQSARIRKHPDDRVADLVVLSSQLGLRTAEGKAISPDSQEGDITWPVVLDLSGKRAGAGQKIPAG